MSTRRNLRDFARLNPDEAATVQHLGGGYFVPRSVAVVRELGTTVGLALFDENHGTPAERAAVIAERATLAQQRGQAREAWLAWRFAALNPDTDLASSRTDPDQHQLAHDRERALALGTRVQGAEARENSSDPERTSAAVRLRARYATTLAQAHRQAAERRTAPPARVGAER
jgi:hypothetical protein